MTVPVVRKLFIRIDLLETHIGPLRNLHPSDITLVLLIRLPFLLDEGGKLVDVVALPKLGADVDHVAPVAVGGVHVQIGRRRGEISEQEGLQGI